MNQHTHVALVLGSHHALVYGCKLIERIINDGAFCTVVITQAAVRGFCDEFSYELDVSNAQAAHRSLSEFLELSELMKRQMATAFDDDPYALSDQDISAITHMLIAPASSCVLQRLLNTGDETLSSRLLGLKLSKGGRVDALVSDKTLSPRDLEILNACASQGIALFTCVGDYSVQPSNIDELADGVIDMVCMQLKRQGSL